MDKRIKSAFEQIRAEDAAVDRAKQAVLHYRKPLRPGRWAMAGALAAIYILFGIVLWRGVIAPGLENRRHAAATPTAPVETVPAETEPEEPVYPEGKTVVIYTDGFTGLRMEYTFGEDQAGVRYMNGDAEVFSYVCGYDDNIEGICIGDTWRSVEERCPNGNWRLFYADHVSGNELFSEHFTRDGMCYIVDYDSKANVRRISGVNLLERHRAVDKALDAVKEKINGDLLSSRWVDVSGCVDVTPMTLWDRCVILFWPGDGLTLVYADGELAMLCGGIGGQSMMNVCAWDGDGDGNDEILAAFFSTGSGLHGSEIAFFDPDTMQGSLMLSSADTNHAEADLALRDIGEGPRVWQVERIGGDLIFKKEIGAVESLEGTPVVRLTDPDWQYRVWLDWPDHVTGSTFTWGSCGHMLSDEDAAIAYQMLQEALKNASAVPPGTMEPENAADYLSMRLSLSGCLMEIRFYPGDYMCSRLSGAGDDTTLYQLPAGTWDALRREFYGCEGDREEEHHETELEHHTEPADHHNDTHSGHH